MAPPVKPEGERKIPCGVSLTKAQHATFKKMGGSAWLQNLLDHEAVLMARARSPRLPGRATARRELEKIHFLGPYPAEMVEDVQKWRASQKRGKR